MAIAIVRRQFDHHYPATELSGLVTEMNPSEGTCAFLLQDSNEIITLQFSHLVSLIEGEPSADVPVAGLTAIDYLEMARKRGWKGQ